MPQKGRRPKLLLVLKEKPSFEGELSIDMVEENESEGHAKYSLVCQKKPPFNEKFPHLKQGKSWIFCSVRLSPLFRSPL